MEFATSGTCVCCTCMFARVHACLHGCVMHTSNVRICMYICACMYMYMHVCVHLCVYACG